MQTPIEIVELTPHFSAVTAGVKHREEAEHLKKLQCGKPRIFMSCCKHSVLIYIHLALHNRHLKSMEIMSYWNLPPGQFNTDLWSALHTKYPPWAPKPHPAWSEAYMYTAHSTIKHNPHPWQSFFFPPHKIFMTGDDDVLARRRLIFALIRFAILACADLALTDNMVCPLTKKEW